MQKVLPYDKFNLTVFDRATHSHAQFLQLEQILQKQLKIEEFTEFGSPVQDCIRIAGRIVNLTTEEGNLTAE